MIVHGLGAEHCHEEVLDREALVHRPDCRDADACREVHGPERPEGVRQHDVRLGAHEHRRQLEHPGLVRQRVDGHVADDVHRDAPTLELVAEFPVAARVHRAADVSVLQQEPQELVQIELTATQAEVVGRHGEFDALGARPMELRHSRDSFGELRDPTGLQGWMRWARPHDDVMPAEGVPAT